MNKLLGFYELTRLGLRSVDWKEYMPGAVMTESRLWTVRVAVLSGPDTNLPRAVGVKAEEAREFAKAVSATLGPHDMIIYYPYFLAKKSGTLQVSPDGLVIEACRGDLWNLVSFGRPEYTLIHTKESERIVGDSTLLLPEELRELESAADRVRRRMGDHLRGGKSVLLEWSLALDVDADQKPQGSPYVVFYECRTV